MIQIKEMQAFATCHICKERIPAEGTGSLNYQGLNILLGEKETDLALACSDHYQGSKDSTPLHDYFHVRPPEDESTSIGYIAPGTKPIIGTLNQPDQSWKHKS